MKIEETKIRENRKHWGLLWRSSCREVCVGSVVEGGPDDIHEDAVEEREEHGEDQLHQVSDLEHGRDRCLTHTNGRTDRQTKEQPKQF